MLKKIIPMVIMMTSLLAPAVPVQAADNTNALPAVSASSGEFSPFFVGVNRITGSLSISSSGLARGMVNVFPKNPSSLDYILTTASLVNSSGIKVRTWTNIKSTMNSNGYFIFDRSYSVPNRGRYKLAYTVKCYKNGVMIDTASSETTYHTY